MPTVTFNATLQSDRVELKLSELGLKVGAVLELQSDRVELKWRNGLRGAAIHYALQSDRVELKSHRMTYRLPWWQRFNRTGWN